MALKASQHKPYNPQNPLGIFQLPNNQAYLTTENKYFCHTNKEFNV